MREAKSDDRQRVIDIISKAFDKNKSVNFIVGQDARKHKKIRLLVEYSFFYGTDFGQILLSDDNLAACILLHPQKKKMTFKSILWDLKLAIRVISLSRITVVLKRERLIKQNHPNEPFLHLWYLGVDPEHQNQGIGSKLLSEVLQFHCSTPVYLETSTYSNLAFYKKFGFEIIEEIDLGYLLFILIKP